MFGGAAAVIHDAPAGRRRREGRGRVRRVASGQEAEQRAGPEVDVVVRKEEPLHLRERRRRAVDEEAHGAVRAAAGARRAAVGRVRAGARDDDLPNAGVAAPPYIPQPRRRVSLVALVVEAPHELARVGPEPAVVALGLAEPVRALGARRARVGEDACAAVERSTPPPRRRSRPAASARPLHGVGATAPGPRRDRPAASTRPPRLTFDPDDAFRFRRGPAL